MHAWHEHIHILNDAQAVSEIGFGLLASPCLFLAIFLEI
jgi:hypothetical protein